MECGAPSTTRYFHLFGRRRWPIIRPHRGRFLFTKHFPGVPSSHPRLIICPPLRGNYKHLLISPANFAALREVPLLKIIIHRLLRFSQKNNGTQYVHLHKYLKAIIIWGFLGNLWIKIHFDMRTRGLYFPFLQAEGRSAVSLRTICKRSDLTTSFPHWSQ